MKLTIAKALEMNFFNRCILVAGKRGIYRPIHSVGILDNPNPAASPGDLLLTTGYVFKDDLQTQTHLLRELAKHHCAGLAIKVKRFLPHIPKAMIDEANRLNLPLIEIPYDVVLSDLLLKFGKEIIEQQKQIEQESHQRMDNSSENPAQPEASSHFLEPEILLQHIPEEILQSYYQATLEPLQRYDYEKGTDLLHTLDVYLATGKRIGEAAHQLYVHRNTLKFRIARIEELLGMDLQDPKVVFRLQLGLHITRILQQS
ncbi:PucR family transcriptional regulator [Thermoflavimicrobium daqui]|nr:PucR family transcriptional regulator ligand-binding domain-containing protein [Thermoflavimicrobium daqui]